MNGNEFAATIILIPAILHNAYEGIDPFVISGLLMSDKHNLVQKEYYWLPKSLSQVDMNNVRVYLIKNHKQMPRTAYLDALQKFEKKTRKE